jgi:hypothetical protein
VRVAARRSGIPERTERVDDRIALKGHGGRLPHRLGLVFDQLGILNVVVVHR